MLGELAKGEEVRGLNGRVRRSPTGVEGIGYGGLLCCIVEERGTFLERSWVNNRTDLSGRFTVYDFLPLLTPVITSCA